MSCAAPRLGPFCRWPSRRGSATAMCGWQRDWLSTRSTALRFKEGEAGGPGRDRTPQEESFLAPQCPCVVVSGRRGRDRCKQRRGWLRFWQMRKLTAMRKLDAAAASFVLLGRFVIKKNGLRP